MAWGNRKDGDPRSGLGGGKAGGEGPTGFGGGGARGEDVVDDDGQTVVEGLCIRLGRHGAGDVGGASVWRDGELGGTVPSAEGLEDGEAGGAGGPLGDGEGVVDAAGGDAAEGGGDGDKDDAIEGEALILEGVEEGEAKEATEVEAEASPGGELGVEDGIAEDPPEWAEAYGMIPGEAEIAAVGAAGMPLVVGGGFELTDGVGAARAVGVGMVGVPVGEVSAEVEWRTGEAEPFAFDVEEAEAPGCGRGDGDRGMDLGRGRGWERRRWSRLEGFRRPAESRWAWSRVHGRG